MAERVDRSWQAKGLDAYPVPAILGTLAHYGVGVDEARFLELAARDYPLTIAETWHERWTGTGPFARFPAAAAEELWRRLCAPRVAPTDVALAVVRLVGALQAALAGTPEDALEGRFAVVEAYLPAIPQDPALQRRFLAELGAALAPWMEALDPLAEALARHPLPALADRFATLEEALFPVRTGTVFALVQAARGDRDGAAASLDALAADPGRSGPAQLAVIDANLELGRLEAAKRLALAVLDRAEGARDLELAAGVVERLTRLLRLDPARGDRAELRARIETLAGTFASGS
jgi:hypothetical protein